MSKDALRRIFKEGFKIHFKNVKSVGYIKKPRNCVQNLEVGILRQEG